MNLFLLAFSIFHFHFHLISAFCFLIFISLFCQVSEVNFCGPKKHVDISTNIIKVVVDNP